MAATCTSTSGLLSVTTPAAAIKATYQFCISFSDLARSQIFSPSTMKEHSRVPGSKARPVTFCSAMRRTGGSLSPWPNM
eukprot:CAMPEP_0175774028 /NCGR_PEP_ID=MMETSP0097-20121207/73392_1 /TAXON_ID=311494 /ORGANISM="Alexandrium monilatum, Strain CCMP3105" /LENGTH=78 /DNA_ID=CAMNT_0017084477 /DNA_START=611 /DNA_END=847 /DNA_ORIENTATION=+